MDSADDMHFHAGWVVWEHRAKDPERDVKWKDQFYRVTQGTTLDTVTKFWQYDHYYPKPSTMFCADPTTKKPPALLREGRESAVLGMLMFRDGVPPETRAKGDDGAPLTAHRFIAEIQSKESDMKRLWDRAWTTLRLLAVGETLHKNAINGVWVANRTRFDSGCVKLRFEVWFGQGVDADRAQDLVRNVASVIYDDCGASMRFTRK